jgi:hypothetical protein
LSAQPVAARLRIIPPTTRFPLLSKDPHYQASTRE